MLFAVAGSMFVIRKVREELNSSIKFVEDAEIGGGGGGCVSVSTKGEDVLNKEIVEAQNSGHS